MGGFTPFRNHLYNLFPHVFRRTLENNTVFCLIIVDLMQFLADKVTSHKDEKTFKALDTQWVAGFMKGAIESYMHSREYRASKAVIALFDTAKNVPTNKARTQQDRSKNESNARIILDEAQYEDNRINTQDIHTQKLGGLLKCRLDGETLWRSNNLKFQLYSLITEELLKIRPAKGTQLIIDDGVSVHPDLYLQRRKEMIEHYFFTEQSEYAKECLVSSLSRHHFTERFILTGTGEEPQIQRLPHTGCGEADIKIPRFLVNGNGTSRYLIVSQDTDIIFILLLHLKSLLPFEPDLEIWLDTQKPSDRSAGISRKYRFIDVKALYYAIIELFEREYPAVENPIETMIFLVYCLKTDFTAPFETCLHVTPRVIWNTFSALHTEPGRLRQTGYLVFNENMYDEMDIRETKKVKDPVKEAAKMGAKRSVERQCLYPSKWWGILNNIVKIEHDTVLDQYHLTLNDVKCQSFLYLVCQFRVLDDLASLGYVQFSKKKDKNTQRVCIPTSDEIFMWTGEIESRVEAHRVSKLTTNKRKAEETEVESLSKKPRTSFSLPIKAESKSSVKRVLFQKPTYDLGNLAKHFTGVEKLDKLVGEIERRDEIEDPDQEVTSCSSIEKSIPLTVAITKKLDELLLKPVPVDYGVPRLQAMIARIYRVEWLMNYHQNGWKTRDYTTNFAAMHAADQSLSCHGWKAREIEQNEESVRRGDFNNSFYTAVFEEGIVPGKIPFKVYEMMESDQVYNRNHLAYLNFGI